MSCKRVILIVSVLLLVVSLAPAADRPSRFEHRNLPGRSLRTLDVVVCGQTITGDTTLSADVLNCPGNGIIVGADDITLDCNGYTVGGIGTEDSIGIHLQSRSGITVRDCRVTEFDSGLQVDLGTGNTVEDSEFFSNQTGIVMYDATDNRVYSVESHDNTHSGIWIGGASSHNAILHSQFHANALYGISMWDLGSSTVVGNQLFGNEYGARVDSDDNALSSNVIQNNTGDTGVALIVQQGVVFKHNTVSDHPVVGVRLDRVTGRLWGNTLSGNAINTHASQSDDSEFCIDGVGNLWDDFLTNGGYPTRYEIRPDRDLADDYPLTDTYMGYSKALWLFDETTGTATGDATVHGNHGALDGGVQWALDPEQGSVLQFPGGGTGSLGGAVLAQDAPVLDLAHPFLIEAWIKAVSSDTKQYREILCKFKYVNGSDTNKGYSLQLDNGKLKFQVYPDGEPAGTPKQVKGTTDLRDDTWHHVRALWDGARISVWVDGVMEAERAFTWAPAPNAEPLMIGRMNLNGDKMPFLGMIDDVRIAEYRQPPHVDAVSWQIVPPDVAYVLQIHATVLEGEPMVLFSDAEDLLPGTVAFDTVTGLLTWTHEGGDDAGDYNVTFGAYNGHSWTAVQVLMTALPRHGHPDVPHHWNDTSQPDEVLEKDIYKDQHRPSPPDRRIRGARGARPELD